MKHLFMVFLAVSSGFGGELRLEDIDLEALHKALPESWYISHVEQVSAPDGWAQKDGSLGVWRPEFVICLMPQDFVAQSANGASFRNGKVDSSQPAPARAVATLAYGGAVAGAYVFHSDTSFKDWKNPGEIAKQSNLLRTKASQKSP
jgi:hypothetical protein